MPDKVRVDVDIAVFTGVSALVGSGLEVTLCVAPRVAVGVKAGLL